MRRPRKDGGFPPAAMPVRTVHSGWLDLHLVELTNPDGSTYDRYVEDHGRAAAVLPYNPKTRMALLVTMPRAALRFAGGGDVLEAPAGLIDDGETALESARRELVEEAGLDVEDLEPAGVEGVRDDPTVRYAGVDEIAGPLGPKRPAPLGVVGDRCVGRWHRSR